MAISNYLLDTSKNQDEFTQKLSSYVAEVHGKDEVNKALDESVSQDDFVNKLIEKSNTAKEYQPMEHIGEFSEENPLIKGLYKAGGAAQYLDKPRSAIIGPIIQDITGGHPLETVKKELSSFEPQPESSVVGRLREMVPNQSPIISTPAEDIQSGDKIKAAAKLWLQANFPKAYGVASNIVPTDVVGLPLDIATTKAIPSIPVGKISSSVGGRLKDAAAYNRERALISEVGMTGSKAAKEIDSLKTQKITNTLNRYGLSDKIADPVELKNALSGETSLGFDQSGNEVPMKSGSGVIGELGNELRLGATHMTNKLGNIDIKEVADNVVKKLSDAYSKESSGVQTKKLSDLQDRVYEVLKVNEGNNQRDFNSLIDTKRNSAKYYFDMKNAPSTPIVAGPSEMAIHKAIWDEVDDFVNKRASNDRDMAAFARQNSDMSDLLNAEEMLSGSRQKSMMAPTLTDVAIGVGAGGAIGQAVGHPMWGMAAGGGLGAARNMIGGISDSVPARIANVQESVANMIEPNRFVRTYNEKALLAGTMKQKVIESYQLPRTYDETMKELPMVRAKLEAVLGKENADIAINHMIENPAQFEFQMPMSEQALPGLYRWDRYRRINGRIFDPVLKQLAEKELMASPLSNTEKMLKQSQLLETGKFDDL